MKKIFLLIGFFSFYSNAQNFEWAKQISSSNTSYCSSVTVDDNSGYVYTTGTFSGTVDFDPGSGIYNLTATVNTTNIYILKLDLNGNFIWAKQITCSSCESNTIKTDFSGNVYIVGGYSGLTDFDPSITTYNLNSAGALDIFISKYDSNGNLVFAKGMGSTDMDRAYSLDIDSFGNIYITGTFIGTTDFDSSSNVFNLITEPDTSSAFILKLDLNGNFIWAKNIGSYSIGRGIVSDPLGNSYITGTFNGTADFDPSNNTFDLIDVGVGSVFILKLDVNGNFVWAKSIGNIDDQTNSRYITKDEFGNIYIAGYFIGTNDFDPNEGGFLMSSLGTSYNGFITKLDFNGNFIWAKGIFGTGFTYLDSITTDNQGSVYCSGEFFATMDFNPSNTVNFNLTSVGSVDAFIAKLDSNGNFLFAKQIGSLGYDRGNGIALDDNKNIYSAGTFAGVADFNPDNSATYILTPQNTNFDAFIQKMNQPNLSLMDHVNESKFKVYPNPTTGLISIDSDVYHNKIKINLKNILGQIIMKKEYDYIKNINLDFDGSPGNYFLEIISDNTITTMKIIKK